MKKLIALFETLQKLLFQVLRCIHLFISVLIGSSYLPINEFQHGSVCRFNISEARTYTGEKLNTVIQKCALSYLSCFSIFSVIICSFSKNLCNIFMFVIFRFNISETGTHAGVVIFSDIGYVKMTIRMNDFFNTKDFNRAVRLSPFYGWRTRIDLGFNVVQNELLTIAGGRFRFVYHL